MIAEVRNYPNGTRRLSLRIEQGLIYHFFAWVRFAIWCGVIYYVYTSPSAKELFRLYSRTLGLVFKLVFELIWLWTTSADAETADSAEGSWMALLRFD